MAEPTKQKTEVATTQTALQKAISTNWTKEVVDEEGEVKIKQLIAYLQGQPRNYRADMKDGNFNINGKDIIGSSLTIQPVAWRAFYDANLLGQKPKEWFEMFFVNERWELCSLLLHSYSVEQLMSFIANELFYADLELSDIKLTIGMDKFKAEKIQGKPEYFIANFAFKPGKGEGATPEDKEHTQLLKAYAKTVKIYSASTVNRDQLQHFSHNFYNPFPAPIEAENEGGTGAAE